MRPYCCECRLKYYLQLAGRYVASMVPLQTQVTWPVVELYVPASVIVPPEMAGSAPVAVAVIVLPE